VVPISERRALVVVVFDGGAVAQQLLELRVATTPDHLRSLSARLTETLVSRDAAGVRGATAGETGVDAEVVATIARALEEHDAARTHDV